MDMLSALAALSVAGSAMGATPVYFDSLGGDSLLQPRNDDRIEARFRADTTNWDTRLEFDSFPDNGDLTGAVANNRTNFENLTFGFDLSYSTSTSIVTWTITRPNATTSVLQQAVGGFDLLNTIQIFTSGSRGEVQLTDVEFDGFGMTITDIPDVSTRPNAEGGPQFEETFLFFGDAFDLLSGNWSLSGDLTFGTFTKNNPSEGSKITIKLRDAEMIPAPTAAALLGLSGLAMTRRRR